MNIESRMWAEACVVLMAFAVCITPLSQRNRETWYKVLIAVCGLLAGVLVAFVMMSATI